MALDRGAPIYYVRVVPPAKLIVGGGGGLNAANVADVKNKIALVERDYLAIATSLRTGTNSTTTGLPLTDAERTELTARGVQLAAELNRLKDSQGKAQAAVSASAAKPQPASPPPDPKHEDLEAQILEFDYEDEESKADKLTLKVINYDLSNFDNPVWSKGTTLEVQWGYPGNLSPRRQCVIQTVKGFQILTVEALDKGIVMNKDTKSRTFENVTRSEVVAQIAKEEGYDGERAHIEDTAVRYEHIVQARTTNAQFMKLLGQKEGFEFFVDFDGLHWHRKKLGAKPIREWTFFVDQGGGDIQDLNVENDVTAKPAAVVTKGRDPLKKENFEAKADDKNTKREGAAPILEAINPRDATTHDTIAAASGTASTHPTTEPTKEGAKAVADGAFRQSQITLVQLTGKCIGDPGLLAKSMVKINGIRSLSGNYYLSSVKHTLNASGYGCSWKAKRDGRSSAAATAAGKPATSSAAVNSKNPPKDDKALEPIEKIDGRHATTTYADSRGRPA